MKSILKLRLETVEDVKKFVTIVERYPGDVSVKSKSYIVSGKSLLGMFSLDLSSSVLVEFDNDIPEAILDEIKPYISDMEVV